MDYKLMCFPCLRKRNKFSSTESCSTDINEQFEYIIDKYTIRKIPLYVATTPQDLFEKTEIESKVTLVQEAIINDKGTGDFTKPSLMPEGIKQRITPIMPVTTHSRTDKEKPRPADILDSNAQIQRRPRNKPNYVVIPSKASLQTKDIMITKREITNQYLNNFSSVFVDNLKDQVPKDPESLPKLSRPYTSAIKNLCVGERSTKSTAKNKRQESCRNKVQKIVYSLPDGNVVETMYDSEDGSEMQGQSADDNQVIFVHAKGGETSGMRALAAPFKTTLKRQSSSSDIESASQGSHLKHDTALKHITYEDIQALDVGYEFSNSEKFGVKPKMTRIRISNHETEKLKDGTVHPPHVSLVDSDFSRRHPDACNRSRSHSNPPPAPHAEMNKRNFRSTEAPSFVKSYATAAATEDPRMRYYLTDASFASADSNAPAKTSRESASKDFKSAKPSKDSREEAADEKEVSRSAGPPSFATSAKEGGAVERKVDADAIEAGSSAATSEHLSLGYKSAKSSSKAFHKSVARPASVSSDRSGADTTAESFKKGGDSLGYMTGGSQPSRQSSASGSVYRSHSFDSMVSSRREPTGAFKEKPATSLRFADKRINIAEEPETETSASLYSRDSKTSSMVTSPVTSDQEVNKKATLRWKIIIKHRKEDDTSVDRSASAAPDQ